MTVGDLPLWAGLLPEAMGMENNLVEPVMDLLTAEPDDRTNKFGEILP